MKTLDEVIEILEHIFSYISDNTRNDMLYYLKEYQKLDSLETITFPEDTEDNPPLTWDELTQMMGEPIWLVTDLADYKPYSRWAIIEGINTTKYNVEYIIFKGDEILNKKYLNVNWKAYKKRLT